VGPALLRQLKREPGWTDDSGKKRTNDALEDSMAENELLTPSEVAQLFRVNPKTVTRWARAGKITAVRTLGGHRRFRAAEVRAFLAQMEEDIEA
jgi:excisionase family DNA binding protein